MQAVSVKKYDEKNDRRNFWLAVIFSIILHALLLFFFDTFHWMKIDLSPADEQPVEPVTFLFPENKPKKIVENMNENEELPDESNLLSDKNSRARNPESNDLFGPSPFSRGNIDQPNLSDPMAGGAPLKQTTGRKFTRQALSGRQSGIQAQQERANQQPAKEMQRQQASVTDGTNNRFDQKKFSADEMGEISLSTYAWEWAPYVNAFKKKLVHVWFAPAAYYQLGLIHGYTIVRFTISREGHILNSEILEKNGHESLHKASYNAINAVFPFRPLPDNFPDETLTITARLIYPNWKARR